jgi:oxygen-dependent protoporphyrinogen oxidase
MARIVIVGSGISGLATAFRLRHRLPDAAITILESESRIGGKIWTERRDGFQVEFGPNGFLDNNPATRDLCRDLGLGEELVAASDASRRHRFLFIGEKLQKLPSGPGGLIGSPLLSWRAKLRLFSEPLRRRGAGKDESIRDFVSRRAGPEAADVFADALVTGIHGGDPAQLSVRAAFPRLVEMEQRDGSLFRGFMRSGKRRRADAAARGEPKPGPTRMWSFRGGLRRMVEALRDQVPAPVTGVDVRSLEHSHTGWIVRGSGADQWPADGVVLTCPAYAQAEMIAGLDATLSEELAGIPYNRIAVVAVGFRQSDVAAVPDGFGFIAPQRTRRDILGVQWCSAIYPDRAPPGFVMWRALCGGVHRGEVVDWDDERLLNAVRTELRLSLGVVAAPVFHEIIRWPRAIPQYVMGHLERVARIGDRLRHWPGLFLGGNAFHGIAMNDCAERAKATADEVVEYLARR